MRLFTAALALVLLPTAVYAAPDIPSLGLQEAIDIALRQNPGLLAAGSDVDAARANERGAATLANPEIVVTPSLTGDAGSDEELSITQPLEINGRRKIRTSIARAEKDASQSAYRAAQRGVIRSVKQAYWEIAGAQSIVDLNRANMELADTLYQSAKRQLDVGSAPGAQAIKAQVELSRARQDLVRSEADLAQAKASLNTLMGRPAETPFELADKLTYAPTEIDVNKLLADATKRPELAEAESANGASPNTCRLNAPNVMNCGSLATRKLRPTSGAALKFALPDWDARTITVPAPVRVTTLPLSLAGPETMLNCTPNPELAVAFRANSGSPTDLSGSMANAMA